MNKSIVFLLILVLLLSTYAVAHQPQNHEVDEKSIEKLRDTLDSLIALEEYVQPWGLQIGIIKDDTSFVLNFGGVSENSMMRYGSITKTLTALAMLKLVEQQIVTLNTPLTEIAPELNINNPYAPDHPVTLAQLMEASAGFKPFNETDIDGMIQVQINGPSDTVSSKVDYKKRIVEHPKILQISRQPGKFNAYHNIGPTITAYLIEKLTGEKFEDFLQRELFQPLEMKRSTLDLTNEVRQYLLTDSSRSYFHILPKPSGSLNSSDYEFLHVLQMLLNKGTYNGRRMFKSSAIERFQTATENLASKQLGIPFGHAINNYSRYYNGAIYHSHSGSMDGGTHLYKNNYGYSHDNNTGYIISGYYNGSSKTLHEAILNFLQPVRIKRATKRLSVEEEDEFLGCYVQAFAFFDGQPLTKLELLKEADKFLMIIDDDKVAALQLEPTPYLNVYNSVNSRSTGNSEDWYVLVKDEEGKKYIQKLSGSFHYAYEETDCNKYD